jgi:hypothetical protein
MAMDLLQGVAQIDIPSTNGAKTDINVICGQEIFPLLRTLEGKFDFAVGYRGHFEGL